MYAPTSSICGSVNRKFGITACEVRRNAWIDIDVVDGIAAIAWKLGTASVARSWARESIWWQPLHQVAAS